MTSQTVTFLPDHINSTNIMKDPCTMALESDQELMSLYEKWDEQQVEEFFNDVDTMNIKCDEFSQEQFTV